MVALKAPTPEIAAGAPSRVVYGDGCYLIPRGGRVVVGAGRGVCLGARRRSLSCRERNRSTRVL